MKHEMSMVERTVPHGWKRGAPLEQHGFRGRIKPTDRYSEVAPWKQGEVIALKLWLGDGQFPNVRPFDKVVADTVYAVSFYNAKDLNDWLQWWFAGDTEAKP